MLIGIAATFFYFFALIMILSAIMVVTVHNPVHSVLFLILAFFNAAALFLLVGAEFLAMILLIVYVGAVAVLFLFVVMMLDVDFAQLRRGSLQYVPIGILIGFIVLAELVIVFFSTKFSPELTTIVVQPITDTAKRTNTQALGDVLYTDYVFYFEVSGLVLLVAMVGAIVLTLHHRTGIKRQSVAKQISRTPETAIQIKKIESNKGI
ncbi:MAG: NADH-quinone oxidoreductase subunit J [Candidatus Tokpelaia sp. JSC189]|nr:MAG: NADH-quinone oxidoreductase subunit J [Candidatus Tokpelaia sp. JSC189]